MNLFFQGIQGIRGLKGHKGEKVGGVPVLNDQSLYYIRSFIEKNASLSSILKYLSCSCDLCSLCHCSQGEDGFPGIKGDFGSKGERVIRAS